MQKKVLCLLADGFEEVEFVMPVDILRRAGAKVTIASINEINVKGAREIIIKADTTLDQINDNFDALVLHGGKPGAENLSQDHRVTKLIQQFFQEKKMIAAICASPAVVLAKTGILKNKKATCFPGCENLFSNTTTFLEDRVVVDENIITSRGLGTAGDFALAIVENLLGKDIKNKIAQQTLLALN